MKKELFGRRPLYLLAAGVIFLTGWALGQEMATTQKTVVHAVAWTAKQGATPQQIEEFREATAKFTQQIPGLRRAWVGKLRTPLTVGDVTRDYGLLLEFDNLSSREAYSSHPNRAAWAQVWDKARVSGSTNFDVLGE